MLKLNFYLFCLMHMIVGFKFEFGADFFEFKRGKKEKEKELEKRKNLSFPPSLSLGSFRGPPGVPPSPERVAQSSSRGPSGTPLLSRLGPVNGALAWRSG